MQYSTQQEENKPLQRERKLCAALWGHQVSGRLANFLMAVLKGRKTRPCIGNECTKARRNGIEGTPPLSGLESLFMNILSRVSEILWKFLFPESGCSTE